MEHKPASVAGYPSVTVQLVKRASLYCATRLGDLRDDVVIVGGLVPSLIVPELENRPTLAPWTWISAWR
jgi:hypothetical protein